MKTFISKMMRAVGVLLVVSVSPLLTSCGCNNGDRSEFLREARFGFILLNAKTGKNLFSTSTYSIDSVRLIKPTTPLRKVRIGIDEYALSIDTIYNETQHQIGQRVEKTYYLYLNRSDTDTIRLSFLPTDGKCNQYFADYQVFYNQRLIATSQNTISFSANINKP